MLNWTKCKKKSKKLAFTGQLCCFTFFICQELFFLRKENLSVRFQTDILMGYLLLDFPDLVLSGSFIFVTTLIPTHLFISQRRMNQPKLQSFINNGKMRIIFCVQFQAGRYLPFWCGDPNSIDCYWASGVCIVYSIVWYPFQVGRRHKSSGQQQYGIWVSQHSSLSFNAPVSFSPLWQWNNKP